MIIRRYLLSTLWQSFSPIFFTLFVISAVVMLLGIASLTSFIKLDFSELITLFLYKIPMVVFSILPISIFASLVSTMAKLSSGNELIVINSLGIKPTKIVREFLLINVIISILALVLSIGINEKSKFYYTQFKDKKKSEAKFNIKASQYGQKFGSWLIYIDEKDENNYKALFGLGEAYYFMDDKDNSIKYFEKVLELNPKDKEALEYLGHNYYDITD